MPHRENSTWRRFWKGSAVVLLGLLAMSSSEVFAQESSLKRVQVAFWPEYDRSDVLVMYRVELDPAIPVPTQVVLPIPAAVGDPHAVAWRNSQGGLMTAQYSREVVGEKALLSITVPSTAFRVEYYAPLEREGDRRSFAFRWPGGPAISELAFEVQSPLGATEVDVSPLPSSQGVGGDGLTYFGGVAGPVAENQTSEIRFTYRKANDTLSAQALAPPASAAPQPTPSAQGAAEPIRPPGGSSSTTPWWPVYVAMALLVGILAGIALQRRKK